MSATLTLRIASTNVVELAGLQNTTTKAYITTASITCDLLDATGATVSGATGLAMPLVAGTSGPTVTYRAIIPDTASLSAAPYTARLSIDDLAGNKRRIDLPCTATSI